DAHARVADGGRGLDPFATLADLDRGDTVTVGVRLRIAGAVVGEIGARVAAVGVLVHLQPQVTQGVGAVVGVGERFGRAQGFAGGVERGVDVVVDTVLPVVRAGLAVGRAVAVDRIAVVERGEGLHRLVGRFGLAGRRRG